MRKKILLLGGSVSQVNGIRKAKELGYETVLCDYLPDNPGRKIADVFYPVSTTDRDAVLAVAKKENVNGVFVYTSDAAAPTAAWVAEQLGLPGNAFASVDLLCNKGKLRAACRAHGIRVPEAAVCRILQEAQALTIPFPLIVKPVDGSGSKGVTPVYRDSEMPAAFEKALARSRCKEVIVEQLIDDRGANYLDGDIIVLDGEVVLWGQMNCPRDRACNPRVPAGVSYPPDISEETKKEIRRILREVLAFSGYRNGAMNVEFIIGRDGTVWLLDLGPRSGGNLIPEFLGMVYGIDLTELLVKLAMGEPVRKPSFEKEPDGVFTAYNLHSRRDGVLQEIVYSPVIRPKIVFEQRFKQPGDPVESYQDASGIIGLVFLKFSSPAEQAEILDHIDDHIRTDVRPEEREIVK